ncbi:MAG: PKD domain-containing protein [Flavobacteriales bacterium]
MKTILTLIAGFFISIQLSAQCTAYLNLSGFNSTIMAEFIGFGALSPQYIIDWGDGSVDTSTTPLFEHVYSSEGQYVILYSYEDLSNPDCSFYSYDSIIITGGSCTLGFNTQTAGLAAEVQAFSLNTALPIYTINWGDGSPVEVTNSALHAYAAPGIYEVCVTLVDADPALPCEITQCQDVEVYADGNSCIVEPVITVNDFLATLTIAGTGSADADYFIDWGDGNYSDSPDLTHTYANPGTYQVCLYYGIDDDPNCQSSSCITILVDPLANCYFDFIATANGLNVELQVLAAGAENPSFYFDWGDGTFGDAELPPTHTYDGPGSYQICGLYSDANNPAGCQLNTCINVTLSDNSGGCNVELTVTQLGDVVTVTSSGTGAANPVYSIDWGDNSAQTFSSTGSHTYASEGAFQVCVSYSDLNNPSCSATSCETVVIANIQEVALQEPRIWPNPMVDLVQIELPFYSAAKGEINLRDATGRMVLSKSISQITPTNRVFTWDVQHLTHGMYTIEIITEYGVASRRVMK